MTQRSATFKQVDVTRALKGAVAAGVAVGGFKINPRTGEIVVFAAGQSDDQTFNPCDELLT